MEKNTSVPNRIKSGCIIVYHARANDIINVNIVNKRSEMTSNARRTNCNIVFSMFIPLINNAHTLTY